jgi:methyl-accepting chemotaxis protein
MSITQLQDPPRLSEPHPPASPLASPPVAPPRRGGSWFANRPIAGKVLLALVPLLLAVIAVGVLAIDRIAYLNERTRATVDNEVATLQLTSELRAALSESRIAAFRHDRVVDAADELAQEETLRTQAAAVDALLAERTGVDADADAVEDLAAFHDAWTRYLAVVNAEFLPLSRAEEDEADAVLFESAEPAVDEAEAALDRLFDDHVTEIEAAAAASEATYRDARLSILVTLVVGVLLGVAVVVLVARAISRPLRDFAALLGRVAQGDLTTPIDVRSRDEIGRMGTALATTLARVREAMSAIGTSAQLLASSSEELSTVSVQMAGSAEETAVQAGVVSDAADQVSDNVSIVAVGAEEMSASIREIAGSATGAAQVAASGVSIAASTNTSVARLGESSAEIGEVVKLISSIAEQTNLLALNATIEAARAGDAGKGFAIVASEVKDLAKETARATEDISGRIAAIQADAQLAGASIGEIGEIIRRISDGQTTIASAVEEQTATTNEMGRSLTEAAGGSTEIARNVSGVADAARSTTTGATDTQRAAMELSHMAAQLQQLVGQFTY